MSVGERARGSFRNRSSGSRGDGACDRHLDDAQYDEEFVGRESASMKFQWTHLMNDKGDTTAIPITLKHVGCCSSDGVRMTTHRECQGNNPRIVASTVPSRTVVSDNKRERMSSGIVDGQIVSRDPDMVLCSYPGLRTRENLIIDAFSRRCDEEGEIHVSYLKDDRRLPLASRNSNAVLIDNSDLRMPNHSRMGEVLHKKYHEEEEISMSRHLKDRPYDMMPKQKFASASPRTAMKRCHERNNSAGNSMGLEHIWKDDFSMSFHEASRYPEIQAKGAENYGFLRGSSAEGRERYYAAPRKSQASEGICLGTVSSENRFLISASEDYGRMYRSRARTVGERVHASGSSLTDNLSESLQADRRCSLQEQPIHIYHERLAAKHLVQQDENESWKGTHYERVVDPDSFLENEACQEHQRIYRTRLPLRFYKERATDVYSEFDELHDTEAYDNRILRLSKSYGIEDYGNVFLDGEYCRSSSIPYLHYGQQQTDGNVPRKLTSHELDSPDLSGRTLHESLRIDNIKCRPSSKHNSLNMISPNSEVPGDDHGPLNCKDLAQSALVKKSGFFRYRKIVEPSNVITNHKASSSRHWLPSPTLPLSVQRHLSKPIGSAGIEIKKPVRPIPQNTAEPSRSTISSSLLKRLDKPNTSTGINVKERLGSASPDFPNPSSKKQKVSKSLTMGPDNPGDPLGQDISSEAKAVSSMTEPPEGSVEFEKLVRCAFLKFVRQLNESPTIRKGYTVHNESGNRLKCGICGSDSREFQSVRMLAQHAYCNSKVTKRIDHLGFHRALCALMGWDRFKPPNAPQKSLELKPSEVLALKEDLIIWPPVVILHNSSIHDSDKLLREEGVKVLLQEMGFVEEKAKVERGKPANYSIIVVKFNGCLSGLQDAEKLHNYYSAERKHGRAEFQEMTLDSSTGDKGESEKVMAEKKEDILYGYLGLAEDIDKLNFRTKGSSEVVSKKDKLAEADTPKSE